MNIDYSQLHCFQTCRRKYYNTFIQNLTKQVYDEREIHLEWGSTLHECLALYYKGAGWQEIIKPCESFQDLENELTKTKANLITTLEQYIQRYSKEDKDWKVLGIEEQNTFKIGSDIDYIVKIDLIIEDRENIYCCDHKTSGTKFKSAFFSNFDPNMQVSGYTEYAKQKYGNCSGFIPNAIFVGHRQRAYKGEPAGFHCDFERTIINRYPQQLEDFKVNVIDIVQQIENCKITEYWSKTEGFCQWCEFKELCISCDDEQIRETLYQTCNPKEYLNSEVKDE